MNKICFYILLLNVTFLNAQDATTIKWINTNSIIIEDSNPNNELIDFDKKAPQKFVDAQFFGFGEASHHGKEFFDLKSKFFKYLVEKQGLRIFMMEESFQSEEGINEWISGGNGNKATIANNFSLAPWYCEEVVDLLEWMRNFNRNKSIDKQIRFYGIDNQISKDLNIKIRALIEKNKIIVNEELLAVLDECAEREYDKKKNATWADDKLPKLEEIEKIIYDFQTKQSINLKNDTNQILRILNYLKNYTIFIQNPKNEIRDQQMFKNFQWLMNLIGGKNKVFIWAHNEHINKKGHSNSIVNLGSLLKKEYGNKYYSVGFDFGIGVLKGYKLNKGKVLGHDYYSIEKTYKKTFAETLFKANYEIYFIDMDFALKNEPTNFFSTQNRNLGLGGSGFNPKKPIFMHRKYTETYDGLIFVKKISKPEYKISD